LRHGSTTDSSIRPRSETTSACRSLARSATAPIIPSSFTATPPDNSTIWSEIPGKQLWILANGIPGHQFGKVNAESSQSNHTEGVSIFSLGVVAVRRFMPTPQAVAAIGKSPSRAPCSTADDALASADQAVRATSTRNRMPRTKMEPAVKPPPMGRTAAPYGQGRVAVQG
jgi:hypothetical protein